jgi:type VI secretion system protein ImpL
VRAMWIAFGVMLLAFVLGAIWLGGWYFGIALAVKVGVTLVLVGLTAIVVMFVFMLRITRAAKIERGLVEQGAKQIAGARPDSREQINALQAQVQKAIAALKQSRLGAGGGGAALYKLPWYVIVGPPGAGKTTAIRHSGLTFPLDQGAAYRGTGGTRNCDWWFTNDAIILDTAGRYATSADDQPEWLGFLDLLRKYRKRKPINGLIVALSVQDLAAASEEQIEGIAKQMRARLDEVTKRLKVLVPVYVVFTKADLIAGFTECWGDLRKSERGQIWGMTLPPDTKQEPRVLFEAEFDALVDALHGRAVRRMTGERSIAVRQAIIHFPVEVAALKDHLATFVSVLFQRNTFQETPTLRGVYLTSGTQNVRPTARVVNAMAAALRIGAPNANRQDVQPPVEAKSFFLTDLFFKIMFPDQHLGGQTEGEKRRQMLLRGAVAAIAMLSASMLVLPAGCTFFRNRELVRTTSEIGAALQSTTWDDVAGVAQGGDRLSKAEARLRQLDGWREDTPVQLRWGMYSGDALYGALRDVYAASVYRALVSGARADLEDRLRALESAPVRTSENFNRDFDYLKLYLMLGDAEHMDPAWATPRLVRQWELLSHAHAKGQGEVLAPHVAYVCELLKRGEIKPWQPDQRLVTRARSILAQVPQVDRLYETLVRDANTEIAPIRREAVFYGSVGPFVKSRNGAKVTGAYTKQGWFRVKALLGTEGQKLAAERWVLGEDETQVGQAIGKLRDLYFERYKNAWRDFIADLEVSDPGNAEYALAELNAMSEPEWPYLRLIRVLSENVTLDLEEPDTSTLVQKATEKAKELVDAGAPPKKRTISPVERAFKPILRFGVPADTTKEEPPMTGLAQWEALVAKLVGALTDFRDGASSSDPKKMSDVFQEAFRATSSLMSEQDGFTRPLLSPLLMQPITLAWSNVVKDAGVAAGATWEVSVWSKWKDKLEGKYPFANSRSDAALDDFLHFFGQGEGGLWSFYDESLKATLDRSGNTFTPSRRFKSSIGYTGPFLDVCLKRGAEITEVLYAPKSDQAAVVFDVNLHSVSPTIAEVTFEVDGVSHTYKNEPEQWVRVSWPGKTAHGARLRVRGASGLDEEISRPGDFGLFRLLDAADVAPGKAAGRSEGTPTLVATWDLRAARAAVVKLDLRPARNEHPLAPGYFKGYTCPRTITAGR